ncbi:signal peptidase II [uncultured Bifidobacterium sp.]|uniref:signal peptidase II n=1 Tax=uncultured Bifidobacterium sp. TaxID=165187 RepID=UPI0028DB6ED3|nr:signal peptidase II [uncultured Bifidobacterium sp.]
MTGTAGRSGASRRATVFACVAAGVLGLDQGTKVLALVLLGYGRRVTVIPGLLSFVLVRNPGATLGLGSSMTWLISLFAIVAVVALMVLASRTDSMRWTVGFALAAAGAAGNLLDRIMHADGFLNGRVIDFLDYGWSVGNIADVALTVAGVLIIVLILAGEPFRTEQSAAAVHGTTADGTVSNGGAASQDASAADGSSSFPPEAGAR